MIAVTRYDTADYQAPPEGVRQQAPCTLTGVWNADMTMSTQPAALPYDPNFPPGPAVVFMMDGWHDGTQLTTFNGISAVVGQAEAFAAERGGEWVISPVRLAFRYDPPEGPARAQHDTIAVAIREKAA